MSQRANKIKPLEVTPRQGEDVNRMIKRFIKKVRSEGVVEELYLRRSYEKPSVKRRRKQAAARWTKMISEE